MFTSFAQLVGYALGRTDVDLTPDPRAVQKAALMGVYPPAKLQGHITSIAVDGRFRGQGLAASLMRELHREMVLSQVRLHFLVLNLL